jgi:predicted metal-dependent phosphoesterase TrpH
MLIDMHVHTTVSPCSRLTLEDILTHSRRRGLDGVCITDHESMAGARALREGRQPDGLYVFFGFEYATPEGDFLIFGPFEELPRQLGARRLLDQVAAAGGVAIAAHPFRGGRPVREDLIREGRCRIVESLNGRNRAAENRAVDGWRRRYDFTECAGSDAHCLAELGRVRTRFQERVETRGQLVRALQRGVCMPEPADGIPAPGALGHCLALVAPPPRGVALSAAGYIPVR